MPDVAKLKKKAAELELKKQFDKALAVYVEILDSFEGSPEEVDVALFNRVGDIYLKQGNVADAVDYYEKAVDHYVDNGFFNNAIALCNKILRSSPGRASIYYKLGKISAHKGFKSDAKANFLEYADRMQKAGKIDESFRALKEFADLCPDQDDIRQMLADQLTKQDRREEAVEQLQLLYERYVEEGRNTEAQATIARMKTIDPTAKPRQPGSAPRRNTGDLVFLDLNDSGPSQQRRSAVAKRATQGLDIIASGEQDVVMAPKAPAPVPAPASFAPPAVDPIIADSPAPTPELLDTSLLDASVLDGVTRAAEFEQVDDSAQSGMLDGFQSSSFGETGTYGETGSGTNVGGGGGTIELSDGLLDFEMPGSASPPAPTAPERAGHRTRPSLVDLPIIADGGDMTSDEPPTGGDLEIIMPEDITFARGANASPATPPAGDVPPMDFDLPVPQETTTGVTGTPRPQANAFDALDLAEPEAEPPPPAQKPAQRAAASAPPAAARPAPRPAPKPAAPAPRPPSKPAAPAPSAAKPAPAAPRPAEPRRSTTIPTPPAARRSATMMAVHSVELLQAMADSDAEDFSIRRRLAEAMLDTGDREGGLRELEAAMVGYERAEDLDAAASIADEIVRLNPASVKHHQKRVEYAFRTNERGRLIEAYLELADALFRAGQAEKSRAIYQRVLDLAPDDLRAQAALESFPESEAPAPAAAPGKAGGRSAAPARPKTAAPAAARPSSVPAGDDDFVNLGDWLRGDQVEKNTRMVVEEQEPSGDEEADFQDMLRRFKQGIAENIEDEDHQSHYDLGVAYKEMGLLDEAIAEFQKALRAPTNRVPTYEALGQCFIEKDQYPMAATLLSRALNEKDVTDEQLVGVLYLLGRCAEERGQRDQALEYYQRVFVIDIQFRDIGERMAAVEGARS
ncbi:MAG TPA: tetratricopeptide repeat protein [Gemmatimonadaceae bacterium]